MKDLYEYFDRNWAKMCRELGLGSNTYKNWIRLGYIPMSTQLRIEKNTNGKFRASVSIAQQTQRRRRTYD